MIPTTRVFLSYKHDTLTAKIVGEMAKVIAEQDSCEIWYDRLQQDQLESNLFNRMLQRYFPDVLSLLVGLRSFLQSNLESCDVILFLEPPADLTPKKDPLLKAEAPGCAGTLRRQLQMHVLFWLTVMVYLLAPFFVFFYGWQLFATFLERETHQILVALQYYWLTPYWWLRKKLGHSAPSSPTFDAKVLSRRWSGGSGSQLTGLGSTAREAWYYRLIYGIELPKLRGLLKKRPADGWQAWELEVATVLGLHPFTVRITDPDDAPVEQDPKFIYINLAKLEAEV